MAWRRPGALASWRLGGSIKCRSRTPPPVWPRFLGAGLGKSANQTRCRWSGADDGGADEAGMFSPRVPRRHCTVSAIAVYLGEQAADLAVPPLSDLGCMPCSRMAFCRCRGSVGTAPSVTIRPAGAIGPWWSCHPHPRGRREGPTRGSRAIAMRLCDCLGLTGRNCFLSCQPCGSSPPRGEFPRGSSCNAG